MKTENDIRAVIFDMDGVLLDTEQLLVRFWCQAAREAGFPMEREQALQLRSLAGKYAAPLLRQWFGEGFDYAAVRARRRELMEQELERIGLPVKEGAAELLTLLRQRGIPAAVATATDEERAARYLKEAGLYPLFDRICCAPMVANGKPMPDIYLFACRQLGEEPCRCLAVEDSPNGVLSAYRAGCQVAMVPDLTPPDEETAPLLTLRADSLSVLRQLLEQKLG